jgi:endonuclease YncB( thermonuclease family)
VRWTDGDSFRIEGGRREGRRARLAGVNALETFGPVHRFAGASPGELLSVARGSARIAASIERGCAASGREDRYGRLLVDCPDAAMDLVRRGHAMVFAVEGPAHPGLLAAQREAQARGEGMWAWGVPRVIVTSVHPAGEDGGGGGYDRLVDAATGETTVRRHDRRYEVCEEVCAPGDGPPSCLRHVPFERRYRDRPECLRGAP